MKELIKKDECPVFIAGYPRSGTTWLQSIISSHPAYYSVPETKFFQFLFNKHTQWTFRDKWPIKPKYIPCNLNNKQLMAFFENLDQYPDVYIKPETRRILLFMVKDQPIPIKILLEYIMKDTAEILNINTNGKQWIEKTPRHIFFLDYIFRLWPKAKVLYIKRNIADIALSEYKTFKYPLILTIWEAQAVEQFFNKFIIRNEKYKDKVMVVYYENLQEEVTLQSIFKFLSVDHKIINIKQLINKSKETFSIIYSSSDMSNHQKKMTTNSNDKYIHDRYLYEIAELVTSGKPLFNLFIKKKSDINKINKFYIMIHHYYKTIFFLSKVKLKSVIILLFRSFKFKPIVRF